MGALMASRLKADLVASGPAPFLPGVTVADYLRAAMSARGLGGRQSRMLVREGLALLSLDEAFLRRCVGEKWARRDQSFFLLLELCCLKPKVAELRVRFEGLGSADSERAARVLRFLKENGMELRVRS